MKTDNLRVLKFISGAHMLHRLSLLAKATSAENKRLRQERDANKRLKWVRANPNFGARECARRRQQAVYDAGQALRRALPSDKRLWLTGDAKGDLLKANYLQGL
jgi:hypothetical protein